MDSVKEEDDSLAVAQDASDGVDGDEVVGDGRWEQEGEARAWMFIGGGAEDGVAKNLDDFVVARTGFSVNLS